jgi:hypothetical protein
MCINEGPDVAGKGQTKAAANRVSRGKRWEQLVDALKHDGI